MNQKFLLTTDPNRDMIISFRTIRRAVGWLGIALPLIMYLGTLLIGDCATLKPSISEYFYTVMGSALVGVLCAVALFQFTYKGPAPIDGILSSIAAVFALGVAFFPCNVSGGHFDCNIICWPADCLRNTIHYISAAGLFGVQATMSVWLFRRTHKSGIMSPQKISRNKVYLICGIIMIAAMATMLILKLFGLSERFYSLRPTFCLETITLWAFGISWLVKGEVVLKDKADQVETNQVEANQDNGEEKDNGNGKEKPMTLFERWNTRISIASFLIAVGGFYFVYAGLKAGDNTYRTSTYLQTYSWTLDVDKTFIEHPELRKYFYNNVVIADTDKINHNDTSYNMAAATAELMLDNWDAILNNKNYFKDHRVDEDSWNDYIDTSFRKSPIIESVFMADPCSWPHIKSVVDAASELKLNDTTKCLLDKQECPICGANMKHKSSKQSASVPR